MVTGWLATRLRKGSVLLAAAERQRETEVQDVVADALLSGRAAATGRGRGGIAELDAVLLTRASHLAGGDGSRCVGARGAAHGACRAVGRVATGERDDVHVAAAALTVAAAIVIPVAAARMARRRIWASFTRR